MEHQRHIATMLFGMWIAGYWPVSDFRLVLKAWQGVLDEVFTQITTDFHFYRYIYRASTITDVVIEKGLQSVSFMQSLCPV